MCLGGRLHVSHSQFEFIHFFSIKMFPVLSGDGGKKSKKKDGKARASGTDSGSPVWGRRVASGGGSWPGLNSKGEGAKRDDVKTHKKPGGAAAVRAPMGPDSSSGFGGGVQVNLDISAVEKQRTSSAQLRQQIRRDRCEVYCQLAATDPAAADVLLSKLLQERDLGLPDWIQTEADGTFHHGAAVVIQTEAAEEKKPAKPMKNGGGECTKRQT